MTGILDTVTGKLGDVAHAVEHGVEGVGHAAGALVQGAEQAAGHVFHGTVDEVKTMVSGAGHAVADVGHGVMEAAHDVAAGARHGDVLGGVPDAGGDLAKAGGKGLADAWHGMAEGTDQAIRGDLAAVRDLGVGAGRAFDAGVAGLARGVGDVAGQRAGDAVRGVAEGMAAPVRGAANFAYGAAGAVVKGAEGMVVGTGDLVVGGVRMGTDAQFRDKMVAKIENGVEALGNVELAALHDPAGAAKAVEGAVTTAWNGFKEEGVKADREGRLAEFTGDKVGAAAFQIVSTLQPFAKVGAVAGAAEKVAQTVGKLGREAEVVGDVGRGATLAGDTAAAAGTAKEAGAVAGDAARTTRVEARPRASDLPGDKEPGVPANPDATPGEIPPERPAPPTTGDRGGAEPPAEPPIDGTGPAPSGPEGEPLDDAKPELNQHEATKLATTMTRTVGTAQKSDLESVAAALGETVPHSILTAADQAGIKIVVPRDSIVDYLPQMKGQELPKDISMIDQPGYIPDPLETTYDSVHTAYLEGQKEVVISTLPSTRGIPGIRDVPLNEALEDVGRAVNENCFGGTATNPLSDLGVFKRALTSEEGKTPYIEKLLKQSPPLFVKDPFPTEGMKTMFSHLFNDMCKDPVRLKAEAPLVYGVMRDMLHLEPDLKGL